MLFDQIVDQSAQRLASLVIFERSRDVARDRIRLTGAHRAANSSKLLLRQSDRNLCSSHTRIIPGSEPSASYRATRDDDQGTLIA